jgi:hypothetical protein
MPLFFRVTALGVDVPLDENRLQNARQWRAGSGDVRNPAFCAGDWPRRPLLEHPPANLVDGQSLRRLASC